MGTGYGDDEESQKLRSFFERGNAYTLKKLQEKFAAKDPKAAKRWLTHSDSRVDFALWACLATSASVRSNQGESREDHSVLRVIDPMIGADDFMDAEQERQFEQDADAH